MDEIVESFGLGQIELAVLESAPGKFPGLGWPNIFECGQRREQSRQHRASAMDVKFRNVFTGRAGRTRKPQHHRIVDRPLADIPKQRAGGHSRRRQFASQRGQRFPACGPETRTNAIALGGRPDDNAKMV